jgi:hypothetical protein
VVVHSISLSLSLPVQQPTHGNFPMFWLGKMKKRRKTKKKSPNRSDTPIFKMGRSREKTVGREKPPFVWLLGYIWKNSRYVCCCCCCCTESLCGNIPRPIV